jgi:predicted RNase H-like nuclease (RuvC/YqgF family)
MNEKHEKHFNDPLTLEELTERVIELGERVAGLEALVEEFRKTREELKDEIRRLDTKIDKVRDELREEFKAEIRRLDDKVESVRKELREEIRRVDAKIDRFFWLWVSTIVAAFVLRVLRLV